MPVVVEGRHGSSFRSGRSVRVGMGGIVSLDEKRPQYRRVCLVQSRGADDELHVGFVECGPSCNMLLILDELFTDVAVSGCRR